MLFLSSCLFLTSLFPNYQQLETPEKQRELAPKIEAYRPITREYFQRYSSYFGRRTNPYPGNHEGLDIAAPLGSPVRAWKSGEVVRLSSGRGCGTNITIKAENYQYRYCHLQGTVVTWETKKAYLNKGHRLYLGQKVKAGEIVAFVGSTGYSTGPHLHIEIKKIKGKNKRLIDPLPLLKKSQW